MQSLINQIYISLVIGKKASERLANLGKYELTPWKGVIQ